MKHLFVRIMSVALAFLMLAAAATACAGGGADRLSFKAPGNVEITVGAAADGIISKLGTPLSVHESPSCGLPGTDYVYAYAGYRVKTTPGGNGNVICQIELTDDSLKTPEGLYIGMPAEEAKTAMNGKGTISAVGEGFSCTRSDSILTVTVRGGVVTGLSYKIAE